MIRSYPRPPERSPWPKHAIVPPVSPMDGDRRSFGRVIPVVALATAALWCSSVAVSPAEQSAKASGFTARGSVEQVYVIGASPGAKLKLVDRKGHVDDSQNAGSLGGIVFRDVKPGRGYRVKGEGESSPKLR